MEFRRSGQRDDRRRRVLRDERTDQSETSEPTSARQTEGASNAERVARDYSLNARRPFHPRTVDFLPKRVWWLCACVIGLLFVVSLFAWSDHKLASTSDPTSSVDREIERLFRPSVSGGIDAWFASSLFLVAALTSLQVLTIRKHKSNDYRGTYQVWGWVAFLMLLASIDCSAKFSALLDAIAVSQWNLQQPLTDVRWSHWAIAAIGALVLARVGLETRRSTAAWVTLSIAVLLYGCGIIGPALIETLAPSSGTSLVEAAVETADYVEAENNSQASSAAVTQSSSSSFWRPFPQPSFWLAGHVMLLTCLLSYARYVYLEAHGIVRARANANRRPTQLARTLERYRVARSRRRKSKEERHEKKLAAKEAKRQAAREREEEVQLEKQLVAEQREEKAKKKEEEATKKRAEAEAAKATRKSKKKTTKRQTVSDDGEEKASDVSQKEKGDSKPALKVHRSRSSNKNDAPPPRKKKQTRESQQEEVSTHIATSDEELLEELGFGGNEGNRRNGGLSKAERRKMRKSQRRNQRRAA